MRRRLSKRASKRNFRRAASKVKLKNLKRFANRGGTML